MKHELNASSARATAPADARANAVRGEGSQYVVSHLRHNRKLIARTRLDRLELHVHGGAVLRAGAVAGDRHERVVDLRNAADRRGDPARHDVSRLDARPFERPHADVETRLIVLRDEVDADEAEQRNAREQHEDGERGNRAAVLHRPVEQPRVRPIERSEEPGVLRIVTSLAVGPPPDDQPPSRHHRRQREADQQRHDDGERHREAKTLHEAADHAAHEPDGHEDRHERE